MFSNWLKPLVLCVFFSFIIFCFLAQGSIAAQQGANFVLNAENMVSWHETKDGFSIKLTKAAARDLYTITKANIEKPLSLFIQATLVETVVIHSAVGGNSLFLAAQISNQKKFHDEILSLLSHEMKGI
jgi:hypothetical protein